jgi:hypothetical protein
MGRSVTITTPIPTVDEMAKRLGVGKRRLATIRRIARQVREARRKIAVNGAISGEPARDDKAAS